MLTLCVRQGRRRREREGERGSRKVEGREGARKKDENNGEEERDERKEKRKRVGSKEKSKRTERIKDITDKKERKKSGKKICKDQKVK